MMSRLPLLALFALAAASNSTLPHSDPSASGTGMLNQAVPWVMTGLFAVFFSQFNFRGILPKHPDAIRIERLARGM